MTKRRRLTLFFSSILFVCALASGLYGQQPTAPPTRAFGRPADATAGDADDAQVQASFRLLANILPLVERNYADAVDPDDVIFGTSSYNLGAIPGMLRTLDPHSSFLDPRTFAQFEEDQEGKYYGVGMTIRQMPGKLGKLVTTVWEPTPGSPAFRTGLRPGDVILAVDGKSTENLSNEQVATLLKGPKGTSVHIAVGREGWDQPLQFDIVRDEISGRGVDDAFLLEPGIAYVHIATFNEKTNDELTQALKNLDEENLRGMVLDLRGNRGGLLQEAVDVADHFLDKGQLIVYHYGRNAPRKRWLAVHGHDGNEYPMVVLIDRMSASAAEIVAGALQDHDRALLMGETSFGKGLVQSEYPLSEKAFLLLTTARYYTPSGRLIQRDYSKVSLYDYLYDRDPSLSPHTEVKFTDGGRKVYGGGGITPDVSFQDPKLTPTEDIVMQHLFDFSKNYLAVHKTIPENFVADDAVIGEFKKFLADQKVQIPEKDFHDNLSAIRNQIRIQLIQSIYGKSVGDKIYMENDPLVENAAKSMDEAAQLLAKAKKYIASRNQAKALDHP